MVNVGCVAKLLSNLQMGSGYWVKRVNPYWYEAREVPKTLLSEKLANETKRKKELKPKRNACKNYKKQYMSPLSRYLARM